jgi:superfamily I DNA/RNA helicase/mRNA-degrading endonuclease RelE of RelBE toxin-antitoxin system
MGVIAKQISGSYDMTYLITHKPAYDADFVELNKDLQRLATRALDELEQDPVTPRGDTIKLLKGWKNLWRYRLGDYRLIYEAAQDQPVVRLLAIGPRKDVYQRFNYRPDEAEGLDLVFGPELAAGLGPQPATPPEWMSHPEWFQPAPQEERGEPLPRKLTPALLRQWLVPELHHPVLQRCRTDEDLLQADVPSDVLGRVMDALWPASPERIASQPDLALFQPEDLERYAEGTLRGFLLHLDDSQQRYTHWSLKGPTLVKGGPGSGKSTVALYRIRALAALGLQISGEIPEILFTTYTNALVNFSESLLVQLLGNVLPKRTSKLPPQIKVTTVDKLVMWIAKSSGDRRELVSREQQQEALRHARLALQPAAMGEMDKLLVSIALQNLRDDYLLEEFDWVVEGQDCRDEAAYLTANRAGRGIPFDRKLRSAVWRLYQVYAEYLERQERCTWGQLRQKALDQVRSGQFTQRWDSVVVDEAQDLTPVALALCVELCREPSGLFLTADANQSLYNKGFRWKNVHSQLNVAGRSRILRRNYRSTREIAEAAADLLAGEEEADAEAVRQEFMHRGDSPVVYAASNVDDQARWLAQQIYQAARELRLPINAAAVLTPTNSLGRNFAARLQQHGIPAQFQASNEVRVHERTVKVLTLHAAKGLEFPIVAIVHVEADRLPRDLPDANPEELAEHLANQRKLFYVGCTRAMRYVFVTHDRYLPSPFLDLLSEDRWLKIDSE